MKILDRFLIILFNICLLIVGIWISAIPIAKSKIYYKVQFKVNEIYEHKNKKTNEVEKTKFYYLNGECTNATFTDEQLNIMIEHIVDYLFGNKDSFELYLDQVEVEGEIKDHVSVFGKQACTHMKDVKNLFIGYQIISVIAFLALLAIFAYILLRIGQIRKTLFRYTLIYYFLLIIFLSSFFIVSLIHTSREYGNFDFSTYLYTMWGDVHYLLFPFQIDKINGSFFNDILTEILTVDLFVVALVIVLSVVMILNIMWLTFTILIRKYGEKIANKIKQSKYSNTDFNSKEYFTSNN